MSARIRSAQASVRAAERRADVLRAIRNDAIREANRRGVSYGRLAMDTGLSKHSILRICEGRQ